MLLNGISLRTKGIGVLVLFLGYTLAAGFIMGVERNTLYSDVQQLEAVHEALHSEQRHVRKIIERLRGGGDLHLRHDLVGDLSQLLTALGEQWRIAVVLDPPGQAISVGASQLHEIRQIAREAVANAARHAGVLRG